MTCTKDFSVIIPHRNSIHTLPRLFDSIPDTEWVEIILVDNTPIPITKEEIGIDREYTLLWSPPERHAGGARNVGIENAHGKWLLFADADDYYTKEAFDVFFSKVNTDADIVYTGMGGIYEDTGERSDRGDRYARMVKDFISGKITELDIRYHFHSPCCKMVRREMVENHSIRYSEVVAGNDAYFSMVSGYYARKIEAIDMISYIATVSSNSLTRRKDFESYKSRYEEDLKINTFLREHGRKDHQYPVLGTIAHARVYGIKRVMELIKLSLRYRQNLFVGVIKKIRK